MSLEKKYSIPGDTIKKMVNDGVISCSVVRNHDIYDYYLSFKNSHPTMGNPEIFVNIAQDMRVSSATVEKVVYEFRKKM